MLSIRSRPCYLLPSIAMGLNWSAARPASSCRFVSQNPIPPSHTPSETPPDPLSTLILTGRSSVVGGTYQRDGDSVSWWLIIRLDSPEKSLSPLGTYNGAHVRTACGVEGYRRRQVGRAQVEGYPATSAQREDVFRGCGLGHQVRDWCSVSVCRTHRFLPVGFAKVSQTRSRKNVPLSSLGLDVHPRVSTSNCSSPNLPHESECQPYCRRRTPPSTHHATSPASSLQ